MTAGRTVAVVWRGDAEARRAGIASNERLRPVFSALAEVGVDARPVVHRDEIADATREELLAADGVLVWVDPVGRGEDRRRLDAILHEIAATGRFVSARPDVIAAMGTKEVLHRTRELGWGTDVQRYDTLDALRDGLPTVLASGPRVLKPRYANGGIGVWKVEQSSDDATVVRVHGAEVRDTRVEDIPLDDLLVRCAPAFADGGCLIDQPFQPRVAEGLLRCYLVADQVVGFAHQSAEPLLTEPDAAERVMGLPSAKTMRPADAPDLARLRALVEHEWVTAMCELLHLAVEDLPLLWDADFLLADVTPSGEDTYVLCEINCSCVTPFPPETPVLLARVLRERLDRRRPSPAVGDRLTATDPASSALPRQR